MRTKKTAGPRTSETSLVAACLQLLAYRGCFAWRQNQGAMKAGGADNQRYIRFAGAEGISDIVGMTPAGQFLSIECKVGRNKPTKEQTEFMARVRKSGGVALLIYSLDELITALKEI